MGFIFNRFVAHWLHHLSLHVVLIVGLAGINARCSAEQQINEILRTLDDIRMDREERSRNCGPIALGILLELNGIELQDECFVVGEKGILVADLVKIAKMHGLRLRPVTVLSKMPHDIPLGAIMILNQVHCVVTLNTDHDNLTVFDPAIGSSRVLTLSEIEVWSGEMLVIKSNARFGLIVLACVGVAAALLFGRIKGERSVNSTRFYLRTWRRGFQSGT